LRVSPVAKIAKAKLLRRYKRFIIYKKQKKKNVNSEFTEIYKRIKEAYQ